MKNLLIVVAMGLPILSCGPSGSEPPQAAPKAATDAAPSEPPPLETVTMDDRDIVPVQEQKTSSRKPVGVPCAWAKIWGAPGRNPCRWAAWSRRPRK